MTLQELRDRIAHQLSGMLGSYRLPNGQFLPALYIGQPPADWRAEGLECIIEAVPDIDSQPRWQHASVTERYRVRLISHGPPLAQRDAVVALTRRFPDSSVTEIPFNLERGILSQHLITIRR